MNMKYMFLTLLIVGCGKGERKTVSFNTPMHSIKGASIVIVRATDDTDPDYSGVAFIFHMNDGEDPLDLWKINTATPGTLEYSWDLSFSIEHRSFRVGFKKTSSADEEPKNGTLVDLLVTGQDYLIELNAAGDIMGESPDGSMGSAFSSETEPYRILSLVTKRNPFFSTISAGNFTNVTLRSSGSYMKEIEIAIPGPFGP